MNKRNRVLILLNQEGSFYFFSLRTDSVTILYLIGNIFYVPGYQGWNWIFSKMAGIWIKTFYVYMFCTYHVCLTFTNVVMYLIRRLPLSAKNANQHCTPNCNTCIYNLWYDLITFRSWLLYSTICHSCSWR